MVIGSKLTVGHVHTSSQSAMHDAVSRLKYVKCMAVMAKLIYAPRFRPKAIGLQRSTQ